MINFRVKTSLLLWLILIIPYPFQSLQADKNVVYNSIENRVTFSDEKIAVDIITTQPSLLYTLIPISMDGSDDVKLISQKVTAPEKSQGKAYEIKRFDAHAFYYFISSDGSLKGWIRQDHVKEIPPKNSISTP